MHFCDATSILDRKLGATEITFTAVLDWQGDCYKAPTSRKYSRTAEVGVLLCATRCLCRSPFGDSVAFWRPPGRPFATLSPNRLFYFLAFYFEGLRARRKPTEL